MTKPKIFARLVAPEPERNTWASPILWIRPRETAYSILRAFDFVPGTHTLLNAVYAARYAAGQSQSVRPQFIVEIVMIRDGVETIIDPENGMMMLALAVAE